MLCVDICVNLISSFLNVCWDVHFDAWREQKTARVRSSFAEATLWFAVLPHLACVLAYMEDWVSSGWSDERSAEFERLIDDLRRAQFDRLEDMRREDRARTKKNDERKRVGRPPTATKRRELAIRYCTEQRWPPRQWKARIGQKRDILGPLWERLDKEGVPLPASERYTKYNSYMEIFEAYKADPQPIHDDYFALIKVIQSDVSRRPRRRNTQAYPDQPMR